jgi:hypothetical protein
VPPPARPPPPGVPKVELLELDELVVVAAFCARCWSALFCDELLLLRDVLLENMPCNTCAICCASPFFVWNT